MTATESPAAAEAWAALVDPDRPQAPGMIVDWLREKLDTDDLEQVRAALLDAAASWVFAVRPDPLPSAAHSPTTSDIIEMKWAIIQNRTEAMRRFYADGSWNDWCDRLKTVADLGPVVVDLTYTPSPESPAPDRPHPQG